jgi:predicted dehydrogenase
VIARIRVGVIGAGAVLSRYHMPAINGVPEVVRSILIDADAERARRAAERYGFPKWSTDIADAAPNSDLAIVLAPNGLHSPVSSDLLSKGVHVLCEKPMARNVEECLAMIDASERGGALLCIGHNRRFWGHARLARQFLQKGLIGDVVNIDAEEGSASDWPRSASYFDPLQAGGGALLDVGIHSIDLIRWIAGEFENLEYKGNGTEKSVESDAELFFQLSTGSRGRLQFSRTRNMRQRILFTGSEGFIELGLWSASLSIRSVRGKAFQNLHQISAAVSRRPPQDSSFVEQLRHFVSAIRGEEALLVTGREGMAAVEVACRAYSLAPGSRSVSLPNAIGVRR